MNLGEVIQKFKPSAGVLEQPFVIAEIGVNHECDMELARRLIREAKEGGADAVKFQTYKAEKLASKHSPSYWDLSQEPTRSQYELFKKFDRFGEKEYLALKQYCDELGIEFLSTPFDCDSADFLDPLMSAFKISSSDLNNKLFIDYLCKKRKPILLSLGASTEEEIERAVGWILGHGNALAIMHCVLNYPTEDSLACLGKITSLKQRFPDLLIGYSDHTLPKDMRSLEVATLLGAQILEKHFTHDKTLKGNDHYHAMDFQDLKRFRQNWERVRVLYGQSGWILSPEENPARENARRSLVANRSIQAGKEIELLDLTFKRPGTGISPAEYENVLGKIAKKTIQEDEILKWEMFE